MRTRVHITVSGRVQGVFFRAYTQKKALALGITGFVKNQADGTVFIDAKAKEDVLKSFIDWCWEGSPLSSVSKVDVVPSDTSLDADGFTITR